MELSQAAGTNTKEFLKCLGVVVNLITTPCVCVSPAAVTGKVCHRKYSDLSIDVQVVAIHGSAIKTSTNLQLKGSEHHTV
jgi:hypothetical protein